LVTERKIVTDVVNRYLLKEYVMKATERAGFGGIDIQRNPMGTLITLIAERPGMVIGHRGKTIKELTSVMEEKFHFDNPQIEVEEERNPNLNANIMAHKLAVALERGWHFRRAGHSTVRKIMAAGARGCQVVIAGKLTGERHRTEKFKEGHIKYCGEPAIETMDVGYAVAKKKLGVIGIKLMIMKPDAVLPDEISILNAEEAKGIVPEAVVEELKIDRAPVEREETESAVESEDEELAISPETVDESKKTGTAAETETEKAEVETSDAGPEMETEPVASEVEAKAEPEPAAESTESAQAEETAEAPEPPEEEVKEKESAVEKGAEAEEKEAENEVKAESSAPLKTEDKKNEEEGENTPVKEDEMTEGSDME